MRTWCALKPARQERATTEIDAIDPTSSDAPPIDELLEFEASELPKLAHEQPVASPHRLAGWWTPRTKRALVYLTLAAVAIGVGMRLTPNGLVVGGDSTTYLAVTKNIVAGKGITSPFVNEWDELPPARSVEVLGRSPSPLWPPGYPVAMASVAQRFDISVEQSARVVSILSLLAVMLAAGWLASRLANGSNGAMLATGLILGFSPSMQTMVSAAYSDLFAAALSTVAIVGLALALEGRKWFWPAALGAFWLFAAATALTRVAGAGMIVAAAVLILWRLPRSRFVRLAAAGLAMSSTVPLYLWRSYVAQTLGGTATNIVWHPRWDAVRETPNTFYHYFIPQSIEGLWPKIISGALLLLSLLIVIRAVLRRFRSHQHDRLVAPMPRRAMIAAIIGYVVATLVAAFYLGALLSVDARTYLSVLPLLVALVVGSAAALFSRPEVRDRRSPREQVRFAGAIPAVLVSMIVLGELVAGWNWLLKEPLVASPHVLGTPDDTKLGDAAGRYPLLFSNSPSNLYVLTGLSSAPPPVLVSPSSGQTNPDHDRQLEEMGRLMRERNGAFVYFFSADSFGTNVALGGFEIIKRLDLVPVGDSPNGYVFAPRDPSTSKPPPLAPSGTPPGPTTTTVAHR